MKEMKDVQIEGFKKTLDPVTVEYLEDKLEQTNRVDLRKITEKASNELQRLENEAAYDYLKIEGETK
jgi:predicted nucleotide-binding protein (sugar kinase/HSP70/actin superfamily)